MQNIIARTSHEPSEDPENTGVKPIAEIEDVIRDLVRRDGGPSNSKDLSDTAENVNSLVQRGASLSELQSVIEELEELYDFLHSEGERLEREISEYARVSKSTIRSTEFIVANLLHSGKTGANKP
jgi:hypothetical protein